jgi:hypothetical protein
VSTVGGWKSIDPKDLPLGLTRQGDAVFVHGEPRVAWQAYTGRRAW